MLYNINTRDSVGWACVAHLLISSVKPLYNGKFIFKIIPEVIMKVWYFSQMYKKSWGVTKYIA
jgi:hypothetical protein